MDTVFLISSQGCRVLARRLLAEYAIPYRSDAMSGL